MSYTLTNKNKVKYSPVSFPGIYSTFTIEQVQPNPILSPISIYLPLNDVSENNLSNIERNLVKNNTVLTADNIKNLFAPNDETFNKCVEYLKKYGEIMWMSKSKTCLIFHPLQSFYDEIFSSSGEIKNKFLSQNTISTYITDGTNAFNYYSLSTLNDPITLPFGMVSCYLNFWNDPTQKNLTSTGWADTYTLSKNQIVSTFVNVDNFINSLPRSELKSNSISLYQAEELISKESLTYFGNFYNAKYSTSYDSDYFSDRVKIVLLDTSLNIREISLPSSGLSPEESFNYDFENNGEMLLDIISVLQTNCECDIKIIYGMIPSFISNENFVNFKTNQVYCLFDLNIVYQYLLEEYPSTPSVISSSYANLIKMVYNDYYRVSLNLRFLSMQGISFFSAAGDTGPWAYIQNNSNAADETLLDLEKPDDAGYVLIGDSLILMGGFNNNVGNTVGLDEIMTMGSDYNPFFSSSGGFIRGYPIPEWKKEASGSYTDKESIQTQYDYLTFKQKIIKEIEIEKGGNIYPDLIFNGSVYMLDQQKYSVGGTSLASPYFAARIAFLNSMRSTPIACLNRIIYTSEFRKCLSRIIHQPTSYGNFNGYSPQYDENTIWDPANGLGIPDFDKMKEILLDTSTITF